MHSYDYLLILAFLVLLLAPAPWLGRFFLSGYGGRAHLAEPGAGAGGAGVLPDLWH